MANDVIATSPSVEQRKTKRGGRFKDLAGKVFFRLTVIDLAPNQIFQCGQSKTRWNCLCQCGKMVVVLAGNLTKGHTRSCGCFRHDTRRQYVGMSHPQAIHGLSATKEYQSWIAARHRVTNKSDPKYPSYGGRGIGMCSQWLDSFETFYRDMGPRPPGTTLDRVDNNGWYSPENCRWSTPKTQARNRRSSMLIIIDGVEKTAVEWSEISGIDAGTIRQRISLHRWEEKRAVFSPSRQKKKRRSKEGPPRQDQ